jgi:excisionase family DNA binding protein
MDTQGRELDDSKNAGKPPGKACQSTRQAVAQFRGVLGEQVVLSSALDPFLSLRALASYSCVSVRKLRELLEDSAHPLPHYRLGSKILVRRSEFDAWMAAYRRERQTDVGRIVDSVMRDLRGT